ncbi:TldD/PmbA family protein [Clostridium sp. YIM B02515]|uniref:TldD/PmbA family protein n=1 Tax=Clostridium rhizosphaerae TaxID=2803861 RepID=A0ABS1T6L2_9CLOT|nr:TldD/PmbA family protein [Clostridium rhizosphaerae]MBL4934296.1 TldD/PmbA family protein [Clostridium rhizosphaerae]
MILKNLNKYSSFISQYTELRVQENRTLNITFLNGNLVGNAKDITNGVSARTYKGGSWGFASSAEVDEESIKSVIKAASDNAVFLDSREKRNKAFFNGTADSFEKNFGTQKTRLSQQEIMDFIREVDSYMASKYPNLSERVVSLRCLDMEKSLITSDGACLYSLLPRSNFIISMTVVKNEEPISLYDVFGGLGQFEDNFSSPKDFYKKIDSLYEHLINKSEGIYAEAGLKECVLHPNLAGILAHEAIGHTTEADLVLGGSIAGSYMNKQVASPLVSLVDYAHTYEGKICPVPIFMDDEGTTAEDVVIIENGTLKGYMHNKESARHFGDVPKGNARAFKFNDEPLIRMRNTAILPGTSKLEDMIASIEDGYYLMNTNNGQADTTSEFMFGIVLGYEIKNGRLGRAIKDTTISGIAFDVLKSTTMVSDDMVWLNGGMCGKKQPITVGMGGPAIKCKVNIGGR